ncbi:MAG: caspase family protein [Proteobacteria bacterium]|nr:caspase family protein [Pseudomonadota bacterium]MBU1611914.1 caspase family protein [Pseudomonadota bacterium]
MPRIIQFSIFFMLIASLTVSGVALASDGLPVLERRVALVIGNGTYRAGPLENAPKDAQDMAQALTEVGFQVRLMTDVGREKMITALDDFGRELALGGVGLFYYAGHGVQLKGRNYLVPVGTRVASASDVEFESIDAGRVLGKMEDAGNGLNIVILDACRNNPFASTYRSTDTGLARMDAPTGAIVAYATAPGKVALDGETGQGGVYTRNLLRAIRSPGVPIEEVFKIARIGVMQETGGEQVPWESSSLIGNFSFIGTAGSVIVAPVSTVADGLAQERTRLKEMESYLRTEREALAAQRAEVERSRKEIAALTTQPGNYVPQNEGSIEGSYWLTGPDKRVSEYASILTITGTGDHLAGRIDSPAGARNKVTNLRLENGTLSFDWQGQLDAFWSTSHVEVTPGSDRSAIPVTYRRTGGNYNRGPKTSTGWLIRR